MADIKQAAKWMQEGRRVTRLGWVSPKAGYYEVDKTGSLQAFGPATGYKLSDWSISSLHTLLADDWEIAE